MIAATQDVKPAFRWMGPWSWRALLPQCLGAVVWGYFFSIGPTDSLELLFTGIVWIPILAYCEGRRIRKHGFLPGAAFRIPIVCLVLFAAIHAPFKYMDRYAGPFSSEPTTLKSLQEQLKHQEIYFRFPSQYSQEMANYDAVTVTLPAKRMRLRELAPLIEQQAGLKLRMGYCGTGESLLYGMHPIGGFNFEALDQTP